MPRPKGVKNKKVETTKEIVVETPTEIVGDKKEVLMSLLKEKVPKLFDRDPQSYSSERMSQLADEIICLLKK